MEVSYLKELKLFVLLVITLLTLLLAGCGAEEASSQAAEEKVVPVEVQTASEGEVTLVNTYQGSIEPEMDVSLVPKIGGRVAEVHVQTGDIVQQGELLITFETKELTAQVAQAEAAYLAAKAQLEKVKAGTRTEQLEQLRAGVSQAEAGLKNAENNLKNARTNFTRLEYLYKQGAASEREFEQAETGLDAAEIGLETAKAQVINAQEALNMAINGAAPEDVNAVEAQVAQAEAGLNLARTQLDNAYIKAPIAGVISSLAVNPGEMAGPSMPVAVVNSLDMVNVHMELTERDVNRFKKGQTVEVIVAAAGNEAFTGKVGNISPVADPRTKTYEMKIEVENESYLLKPGMSAVVEAVMESVQGIVIPSKALLSIQEQPVVFSVEGDKAVKRTIELGLDNGDEVLVSKGVAVGEEVVVTGQQSLEDGVTVKVTAGRESK